MRATCSRKLSLKGVFKTGIVFIIAESDEIDKKAHLAFSHEIMGADILEKLSYHSVHAVRSQKLSLHSL